MPRALGRDRLEAASGGHLVLLSAHDKGWKPRLAGTRLTPEHPGTAVRWEEQLFEVLDVDALGDAGVRYTLALWDARHAIRIAEAYDEAGEIRRQHEREAHARRERHRGVGLFLAPLLGCLPGKVQEELENEYAIPATRMTLLSALPLMAFGIFCFLSLRAVAFGVPPFLPLPVLFVGQYFWFESLLRACVCLLQGRPIGSAVGHVAWAVWRGVRPEGARAKRLVRAPDAVPVERAALDSFIFLEPFLSFLSVADQESLKVRYGFDGVRRGKATAIVILVAVGPFFAAAVTGTLMAPEPADLLRLAVSGTLVVEQALRLRKLAGGEVAPSMLRVLVRPLAWRLFTSTRS